MIDERIGREVIFALLRDGSERRMTVVPAELTG
jgi:hypothetical protein